MNHNPQETCSNCRFWQPTDVTNAGKCKWGPPIRVGPQAAAWPTTPGNEFCFRWDSYLPVGVKNPFQILEDDKENPVPAESESAKVEGLLPEESNQPKASQIPVSETPFPASKKEVNRIVGIDMEYGPADSDLPNPKDVNQGILPEVKEVLIKPPKNNFIKVANPPTDALETLRESVASDARRRTEEGKKTGGATFEQQAVSVIVPEATEPKLFDNQISQVIKANKAKANAKAQPETAKIG